MLLVVNVTGAVRAARLLLPFLTQNTIIRRGRCYNILVAADGDVGGVCGVDGVNLESPVTKLPHD